MNQNKLIYVGIIVGPHGIKGHSIVKSFTDPDTNICSLPLVNELDEKFSLNFLFKKTEGILICKINDYNNRNDILNLKGTKLYCLRNILPEINTNDEYYIEDLKGLKVYLLTDLKEVGIIKNIHNFGAGEVIEIIFADNKHEYYPFTAEYFGEIKEGFIILNKRIKFLDGQDSQLS